MTNKWEVYENLIVDNFDEDDLFDNIDDESGMFEGDKDENYDDVANADD